MSALSKKLRRDLLRLKGQVATIALVLACGIMAMIMLRSSYRSLLAARDSYYTDYRFADVFARVERAPRSVAIRLGKLPGVALAYPRIVEDVMIPLADEPDPPWKLAVRDAAGRKTAQTAQGRADFARG